MAKKVFILFGLLALSIAANAAKDGTFTIPNLPGGPYILCAQSTTAGWLDPCHWASLVPLKREILAALAVLQKWKYGLPEHEVRRLLNLPSSLSTARIGAILYASELPGNPFSSQVRALINDADRNVAEIAARASSTRTSNSRPGKK
jgi:hypothetical protein